MTWAAAYLPFGECCRNVAMEHECPLTKSQCHCRLSPWTVTASSPSHRQWHCRHSALASLGIDDQDRIDDKDWILHDYKARRWKEFVMLRSLSVWRANVPEKREHTLPRTSTTEGANGVQGKQRKRAHTTGVSLPM
jgi:hypothetical protein